MKSFLCLVVLTTVALWTGCGGRPKVETGRLEASFQSAEPMLCSAAEKVIAAVRAEDYPEAMAGLQMLAQQTKLTPAQQQAIADVMAQLQKQPVQTGK